MFVDKLLPSPATPKEMEVWYLVSKAGQNIEIVVSSNSEDGDALIHHPSHPCIEDGKRLIKLVGFINYVASQDYYVNLSLDRSINERLPSCCWPENMWVRRLWNLRRSAPQMNIARTEYANGHS